MPLGILEDTKLEHVPGTAPLNELGHAPFHIRNVDSHILKHDPTGLIVLVPQPSDSPDDPYNWPRLKKELFTLCIIWGCGCVGALGPLLGPAFVTLAAEFDVSLQTFVGGVQGGLLLANAIGSVAFNTLAVKYGKRPFYLVTTLGLMVTCFWCAAAKSFASLVAARVLQGFLEGPVEALMPSSIADVWFVHERGFRSAIFTIATLSGISLSQPIAGAIIEYSSYKVSLYALGGAFGLQLIMMFFWMPETAYDRHNTINIDTGSKNMVTRDTVDIEDKSTAEHIDEGGPHAVTSGSPPSRSSEQPTSWARELLPYSGYVHKVPFWNTLFRPFYLLASPSVLYGSIIWTLAIGWLIALSIVLSQVFASPPYSFSIGAVGLTNMASFVGSILGTLISGPTIDGLVRRMARINGGTFEPEFRLPIMTAFMFFTGSGAFIWGWSLSEGRAWPIPVVLGLGFMNFGIQLGVTGVVAYVIDCHRERSSEALAIMNFWKGIVGFVLTATLNDWIVSQGVLNVFYTLGGVTIGLSLLTVPMYIYGKKARSWARRHNIEGKQNLKQGIDIR